MGCGLNDGLLFVTFVFGISVEAGEPCYTGYYTLEFCDHGCCGTTIPDRYCCHSPSPELGTIIGYSVGSGVLFIIVITIIICLCKYTGKNKTNSYIQEPDGVIPSISVQTEPTTERCDVSFHSHFRGIKHTACSRPHTKRVGLNSNIIEEPCTCGSCGETQGEPCTIFNVCHVNGRTMSTDTNGNDEIVLTPVLINNQKHF